MIGPGLDSHVSALLKLDAKKYSFRQETRKVGSFGIVGFYPALFGRTSVRVYPMLTDSELRATRISGGELPVAKMAFHLLQKAMSDTVS